MNSVWVTLLIILAVVLVVLGVLYFLGRRMQKQVDGQQAMIDQSKQVMSMLIIDKKKMKIADSNLPKMVVDQVPWYFKFRKMPMVKAKVGPKIMTLMCEDKIFKDLPVKKQVKVELAGIYIVKVLNVKK